MATATITRPAAPSAVPTPVAPDHTAGQKAAATLVIASASALTLGVFAWAAWIASQISIPV